MGSPINGLEKVDMGHEMQLVKGPHEVIPYSIIDPDPLLSFCLLCNVRIEVI